MGSGKLKLYLLQTYPGIGWLLSQKSYKEESGTDRLLQKYIYYLGSRGWPLACAWLLLLLQLMDSIGQLYYFIHGRSES